MRENVAKRTQSSRSPVSVRFNDDEWEWLNAQRGNLPISTYIKGVVFSSDMRALRKSAQIVTVDHEKLGQVLALLGRSELAANVALLAEAAKSGSLYFDDFTVKQITRMSDDIWALRTLLMEALGKKRLSGPVPRSFTFKASGDWQGGDR